MAKKDLRRYVLDNSIFSSVSGISNETGFRLMLTDPWGNRKEFSTKNYREKTELPGGKIDLTIYILSVLSSLALIELLFALPDHVSLFAKWMLAITGVFTNLHSWRFAYGLFLMKAGSKEALEWHACEHKSYVLLKSGLEPTIENLRRCPSELIWCGGSHLATLFEASLSWWIAMLLFALFPESQIANFICFALMTFFGSVCMLQILIYRMFPLSPGRPSPAIIALAKPAAAMPLAIQKFFTTAEPPEEKLNATLMAIQNFIGKKIRDDTKFYC